MIASRVAILGDAKSLYMIWQYRMGVETPWEHLSNKERQAFVDILEVAGDPELMESSQADKCPLCSGRLSCGNCDPILCPQCNNVDILRCYLCWSEDFDFNLAQGLSLCVGESQ